MSLACVLEDAPGMSLVTLQRSLPASANSGSRVIQRSEPFLGDLLPKSIDAGEQQLEFVEHSASRCERLLEACDRIGGKPIANAR